MYNEPIVTIDEAIVRENIRAMSAKANKHSLLLRPHFKTHQSAEIGEWFRQEGISSCAVSSFKMAQYFARNGWQDIMIAFPVIPGLAESYKSLAEDIKIHLFLSDPNVFEVFQKITKPVEVMIELDTGNKRSGINIDNTEQIDSLVYKIQNDSIHHFSGFAIHAGETYHTESINQIQDIYAYNQKAFQRFKEQYPAARISFGDTPSITNVNNFDGIDELRPGNFVFFDWMQRQLGSCCADEIAMTVDCPVVASYDQGERIVVHGGTIHLSKEAVKDEKGRTIFGIVAGTDFAHKEPIGFVESLSQEHGIIKIPRKDHRKFAPGDTISIWPVHSCLVADIAVAYKEFHSGRTIDKM
ncbi:MAG: alanine racemase [Bacteroidales bacterium]